MLKLRTKRAAVTIAERRYVPRKGQSCFPCGGAGRETNLTMMIP